MEGAESFPCSQGSQWRDFRTGWMLRVRLGIVRPLNDGYGMESRTQTLALRARKIKGSSEKTRASLRNFL
jgi:hypothetical protein